MNTYDMVNEAVLLGNGMHAFNHAHGLGFLERIKGEFGCEILFHGYGIERLFRGSSLPRVFKSIGPVAFPAGAIRIPSPESLKDIILLRTYNVLHRKPWRLFRQPFRSMFQEIIEETASSVTEEALECGGSLEDAYLWPDVYYHSRSSSFLFVASMRPWVAEQCLVFDRELFDLHLRIPSQFRYGNKLWLAAMRSLSPSIAKVPDANTGCPPSLPQWVQQIYKSRSELLRRLPGLWRFSSSRKNEPIGCSPISWPRFDWMIAHNSAMRRLVDAVIHDPQAINPDLFDMDAIRRILADHVEGRVLNRFLIFLILTFGIWHKITFASPDQGGSLNDPPDFMKTNR